jgi:hypothetical protein
MKPIHQTVHDFWFEAAPPARLAMLRILVGAYALYYLVPEYDDLLKVAQSDPKLFAPVGVVFHAPIEVELFRWLLRATLLSAACFAFGLCFRITGPVFAGLLLWLLSYRNSWSMIYHSDNLLVLHVIVLGLTRAADVLSLDAFIRRVCRPGAAIASQPDWQYGWPVKLMCAMTVSAYFVTSVAKLSGPLGLSWVTGQALRSQMAVDAIRKELLGGQPNPVSYSLYDWLPLFTLLGAGSLALEFFAPLALLNKRVGRIWAINAFLMHWGILLVMRITFLYQLSGVIFAPFFRVERLLELPRTISRRRVTTGAPEPLQQPAGALAAQPHTQHPMLLQDSEGNLFHRFVHFVLRHERRK